MFGNKTMFELPCRGAAFPDLKSLQVSRWAAPSAVAELSKWMNNERAAVEILQLGVKALLKGVECFDGEEVPAAVAAALDMLAGCGAPKAPVLALTDSTVLTRLREALCMSIVHIASAVLTSRLPDTVRPAIVEVERGHLQKASEFGTSAPEYDEVCRIAERFFKFFLNRVPRSVLVATRMSGNTSVATACSMWHVSFSIAAKRACPFCLWHTGAMISRNCNSLRFSGCLAAWGIAHCALSASGQTCE